MSLPLAESTNMRVAKQLVTPQTAKEWLTQNFRNRAVFPGTVARYAELMLKGQWRFTPDAIAFYASDGALANGQQRLGAVVLTETSQYFLVVWNLPDESEDGLDQGRRRNAADLFLLKGLSADRRVPAAYRYVVMLRRVWEGEMASFGDATNQPSIRDLVMLREAEPSLAESLPVGIMMQRSEAKTGCSLAMALHYVLARAVGTGPATEFFERVSDGLGFDSTRDPRHRLRQQLIFNARGSAKLGQQALAARYIKAWNFHHAGEQIEDLRWSRLEEFPKIGTLSQEAQRQRRRGREKKTGAAS